MPCAKWLENGFNIKKRTRCVEKVVIHLQEIQKIHKIDFIAVTGVSGMLIGPIVSHLTGIPIAVRRNGVKSHSWRDFEYDSIKRPVEHYVVIDDVIETGKTLKAVGLAVKRAFPKALCVGIILYSPKKFSYKGELEIPHTDDMQVTYVTNR